jgi:hypothetical protein
MVKQKNSTILEWVLILGLTACAIAASEFVGLTPLWMDAAIYTVIVFAVAFATLRPPWRRRESWQSLAVVFIGHTLILLWVVLVLQEFPTRRRFGMPKLLLIPLGSIECVFIVAMLWKRMKALRTSELRS